MKYLRYYAEFYDRNDRKYRVEVYQESETAYTPVEVELAAEPVTLEWNEVEKLDPVRGSGATLRLISMTDRQFYDMYSVDYGVIELNVLREENGAMALYWAGTLDPELFSEPYAYADRYVTEHTFVDLAVLEYAEWDGEGRLTADQIIDKCIASARITGVDLPRVNHISTVANLADGSTASVLDCVIAAENFYDEDGEAMTMREVLEETLRPFGLQITQRNGQLHIYDCQALSGLAAELMEWYSNDATLEVDKVYNNVRVRFSPADIQEVADTELDPEDILQGVGISKTMAGTVAGETEPTGWFTLHFGSSGTREKMTVKNGASFFRIEPIYSGDEEAGVLWGASFPDFAGQAGWVPGSPKCVLTEDVSVWPTVACTPIIELDKFYVRGKTSKTREQILISLDLLYDQRSNFYEDSDLFSQPNDTSAVNTFKDVAPYTYIPIVISLWSEDGECMYRYSNNYRRRPFDQNNDTSVGWVRVSDERQIYDKPAWLCYYNDSFDGKSGLSGWTTNKRIVGPSINGAPILTETQKRRNAGEYIELPPVSGYIKIEICSGLICHTDSHNPIYYDTAMFGPWAYQFKHGWFAYKDLKVRYVPTYGGDDDFEEVDFEDSGYINKLACEELDIDTIVGTAGSTVMAKGDICAPDGQRLTQFTRGGYTDRLERLLIGTAYSQYASRKNVLSGTIESPETFGVLSDATIDGKYMVVSEVQNVEDATSEIRAIEVVADKYEAIEEVVE